MYQINISTYDLCKDVLANENLNKTLCPKAGICGCPVKAKTYIIDNIEDAEPDLPVPGALIEGDYHMNCVIVDRDLKKQYGCVNVDFTIKKEMIQ